MDARDGAGTPGMVVRDVNCPVCRRFINKVELVGVESGTVRVWAKCQNCGKWRWCAVKVE
jgi:transcription elongation factor Elf1